MATYAVRVLRSGQPVAGAQVVVAETLEMGVTGADGCVSADLPYNGPVSVALQAYHEPEWAHGTYRVMLTPGETFDYEVG